MIAFGAHTPRNHIQEFFLNILYLSLMFFPVCKFGKVNTEKNQFIMRPKSRASKGLMVFTVRFPDLQRKYKVL